MSLEHSRQFARDRKRLHPPGTRVRLIGFAADDLVDDNQHVPPGTAGVIVFADDRGTLHVRWDNGVTLGLTTHDLFEPI